MKTFEYKIKDELGIHARPAGVISKAAKDFKSEITIEKNGKSVNAEKLIMLMGLGIKCGDIVKICADGDDEESAIKTMEDLFNNNL